MFGDAVELTDDYAWWWLYIPHFVHSPFYCYAYAFGELLVLALLRRYDEEGAAFVPRYLELLRAGGSESPAVLLSRIGLDVNDPALLGRRPRAARGDGRGGGAAGGRGVLSSRPLLLCALLVAIAVVGGVRAHQLSMQTPGIDFYQFWALGQAVDEGLVGDIYEPAARHRLAKQFVRRAAQSGSPRQQEAADFRSDALEAASTPFLYSVFFAIQTGEYDRDISRYRAVSVALSLVSIAVLCWLVRADPVRASVALVFATWAWVPLGDDLVDGNVNQVQLALLSLFLVLQQRAPNLVASVAAGAVLGLANFFKPNLAYVPLALTLGWVVDRSWGRLLRCWAGVSLGAGVAVAVSSVFFGTPRCWIDWLELFRSFDRHFDLGMRGGTSEGRACCTISWASISAGCSRSSASVCCWSRCSGVERAAILRRPSPRSAASICWSPQARFCRCSPPGWRGRTT